MKTLRSVLHERISTFLKERKKASTAAKQAQKLEKQARREAVQKVPTKHKCVVCLDVRKLSKFPCRTPTGDCKHKSEVCKKCLTAYIASAVEGFGGKFAREVIIGCPSCSAVLGYKDVRTFATKKVFDR